jgi:hypothetical protein
MFTRVDANFLNKYAENDYLLPIIKKEIERLPKGISDSREYRNMITHQWKRAMFNTLYTDLSGKKILDIGGFYSGYPKLLEDNDYTLVDPDKNLFHLNEVFKNIKFIRERHNSFVPQEQYDYVICCDVFLSNAGFDVFPDVFFPFCKEIRFSLTFRFFNQDIYIGETLDSLNAWLYKYCIEQKRNLDYKPIFYEPQNELPNSRNVYLISLKGDLK